MHFAGHGDESEPWLGTWSSDFDTSDFDSSDSESLSNSLSGSSVVLTTGGDGFKPAQALDSFAFSQELDAFEKQMAQQQLLQAHAQAAVVMQPAQAQIPLTQQTQTPQTPPMGWASAAELLGRLDPQAERRTLTAAEVKSEPQPPPPPRVATSVGGQGMEQAARMWAAVQKQKTSGQKVLPDVKTVAQWDLLPTPTPGKPLRWTLAGKRFFVQLSDQVSSEERFSLPVTLRQFKTLAMQLGCTSRSDRGRTDRVSPLSAPCYLPPTPGVTCVVGRWATRC